MSKAVATAIHGLRFGLLIGLGESLLDTFVAGFQLKADLRHLFFCSLGGLIGSFSYRWLFDHRASQKLRQPLDDTAGDGI